LTQLPAATGVFGDADSNLLRNARGEGKRKIGKAKEKWTRVEKFFK